MLPLQQVPVQQVPGNGAQFTRMQRAHQYGVQVKNNAVAGVYNAGVSAKEFGVRQVTDAAKFAIGLNNVTNAYEAITEERKIKAERLPTGEISVTMHEPSSVERIRQASGEVTIGAAKLVAWSMFAGGGVSKAVTAMGLMSPVSTFSLAGMSEAVYTGMTTVGSSAIGASLFITEKAIIPTVNFVGGTILSNPINSIATAATGAILYSAAKDIAKITSLPEFTVQGNNVNVDVNSVPTFMGKVKLGAMATIKAAAAAGVIVGTVAYNLSGQEV